MAERTIGSEWRASGQEFNKGWQHARAENKHLQLCTAIPANSGRRRVDVDLEVFYVRGTTWREKTGVAKAGVHHQRLSVRRHNGRISIGRSDAAAQVGLNLWRQGDHERFYDA